jgi:hypothetical protein
LKELVTRYGTKNWKKISSFLEGRTTIQCFYRWNKVLKYADSTWTEEENSIIRQFVSENGYSSWTKCAKLLKLRTSKQIKRHWFNDLADKESLMNLWTDEDELKLILNTSSYGTCWSRMRHLFPGRDEISIKNKFYSILRRTAGKILGTENLRTSHIFTLKQHELIKYIPNAITEMNQKVLSKNIDSNCENGIENILPDMDLGLERIKNMYFCSQCKDLFKKKMKEKLMSIYRHNDLLNKFSDKLENLKEKEISMEKYDKIKTMIVKLKYEFDCIQTQL